MFQYADNIDHQDDSQFGPYRRTSQKTLDPDDKEDLRLKINGRERERMHDLNSAMDALRQVKLKIATSNNLRPMSIKLKHVCE